MRTDRLIEAAFPDCVYLLQFATKHTKSKLKPMLLNIFYFFAPCIVVYLYSKPERNATFSKLIFNLSKEDVPT